MLGRAREDEEPTASDAVDEEIKTTNTRPVLSRPPS
jgi:hypothetical protein